MSLDSKTEDKVFYTIDLLKEHGPALRRPYTDTIKGKIREPQIRFASDQIRILYFFFLHETIVLLHGFRKKTDEVPVNEIKQAERNMDDFMTRFQKGEIAISDET